MRHTWARTAVVAAAVGIMALSLCLFLSGSLRTPAETHDPLEELLRGLIGKPTGELTESDFHGVTGPLWLSGLDIADIGLLALCTDLEELHLSQ